MPRSGGRGALGNRKGSLLKTEGVTMNTTQVRMKGTPVAIERVWDSTVRVWVSSPTGDSSDSFTYDIPCLSESQADTIARQWRKVWGLL